MVKWDFNEDKNFVTIGKYKVLNLPDAKKAANLLGKIDTIIKKLFKRLKKHYIDDVRIKLLLDTPYNLQEMQILKDQGTIKFDGLNKPKNVFVDKNAIHIGLDKNKRAEHRLIFLKIRNDNNILLKIQDLYKLIAHELTHTALNHVTWKDDNHSGDFNKYNKLILNHLKL